MPTIALLATRDPRIVAVVNWAYRWRMWLMVTGVGALAGLLRFVHLGYPRQLVFDEVYYARGGYSLLQLGYYGRWEGDNQAFAHGDFSGLTSAADYAVHPPVGWWMIAWGIKLFGPTPFGWRFSAALFGTLTVVIVALIAKKLFDSVLFGGIAGLLLAIDGEHIVMSRTALLDIFLTFFVVVGFGFLVLDRARTQRRLVRRLDEARERLKLPAGATVPGLGPYVGIRWWRLAALAAFGLSCGVKWSGLYFVAFFMLMSVLWDMVDRRAAGVGNWFGSTALRALLPGLAATLLVVPGVYVATWAQWYKTPDAYFRDWAELHPGQGEQWLPEGLRSLWHYHTEAYDFHKNLGADGTQTHPYQAKAWSWPLQIRPTAFYFESIDDPVKAQAVCGSDKCSSAITSLGNPLIWWAGTAALFWAVWRSYVRRDVLAGSVMIGVFAGWLPWFGFWDRLIYTFYTVSLAPFVALVLAWAALRIAKPPRLEGGWSRRGGLVVGGFMVAALAVSAFFWPLWAGQWIPYDYWLAHMWLPTSPVDIGSWHWDGRVFGERIGWV